VFDIGFSELVLVFVIGLVVLGPQRLPIAVKTVVGWIRAMRSLAANVQNELAQELKLQELQDSLKKVEQASKNSLSPELKESMEELRKTADSMRRSYLGENEQADDEAHTIHNPLIKPQDEHTGVTPGSADHQASAPAQKPEAVASDADAAPAAAQHDSAPKPKPQAAVNAAAPEMQPVGKPVNTSAASAEPAAAPAAKTENASPATPAGQAAASVTAPVAGEKPASFTQPTMNDEHGR
jgi:sec-independent protein translocase protein TatB